MMAPQEGHMACWDHGIARCVLGTVRSRRDESRACRGPGPEEGAALLWEAKDWSRI